MDNWLSPIVVAAVTGFLTGLISSVRGAASVAQLRIEVNQLTDAKDRNQMNISNQHTEIELLKAQAVRLETSLSRIEGTVGSLPTQLSALFAQAVNSVGNPR